MVTTTNNFTEIVSHHFSSDKRSRLYQVYINGQHVPVTEYPGIEAADYEKMETAYRKMHSACWVDARFAAMHYAHLSASGTLKVEITASEAIQHFTIHPKRRRINGNADGYSLRFNIQAAQPNYLIIDINDLPLLCLLIDPPEERVPVDISEKIVHASQFLSDSSGQVDQTEAFARAIEAVNGTGKTLVIPAGVYLSDTIKIQNASNFHVYFSPGTMIRTKLSEPGVNRHSHGIWIDQSTGITLSGPGYIDHQAYENFFNGRNDFKDGLISWAVANESCPYTSMSPLCITRSKDITIERLVIRNSRNFNFNVRRSDNVIFRYCKAFSPPVCLPEYTDGFNINSCNDFLIEDCFVFCNDDCFASGHYFDSYDDRPSGDCTVRGLVGWNPRANGVRIGFYAHYNQGRIVFENCDFIDADDSGVIIHALKDAPECDRSQWYDRIQFINCGFDNAHRYSYGLFLVDGPRMRSLEFTNIEIDGVSPKPARIEGHPKDKILSLKVHNLRIGGRLCRDLAGAGIVISNVEQLLQD